MTNWIMKIPNAAAGKLNCSYLTATIKGTASKAYLNTMDPIERRKVFFFDWDRRSGRVWAIKMKLITLKSVPRISPLPIGLRPIRINNNPAKMDKVIALEQYFFCA